MELSKQITQSVSDLLKWFESSQWNHHPKFNQLHGLPILYREDFRNLKMENLYYQTVTTGSTGQPVVTQKTVEDQIWYLATNIREIRWRKWDITKNIFFINAKNSRKIQNNWGVPIEIEPIQGKAYFIGFEPIKDIQAYLEEVNPHYIQAPYSIIKRLDLTKISNFIDYKGSGEIGGSLYSSEECGTIAIQCPDNKNNYHVMENQLVEQDTDKGIIISTLTNPYIRRYKHGDLIEIGQCNCGRSLQTITKIYGRVRNLFKLKNGDVKYPLVGSLSYHKFGIKQFKCIQIDLDNIELNIICEPLGEREIELINLVKEWLSEDVNIKIVYVDSFNEYKHEEFVSLVT
jgi:phenylacetate-coenzyme A ligase PaaK-like adenylate-forming protein